ncbi:forespore capture DNA-binding protein RefZ [Bacillus suaedae]|uniref:Forespore capture DNA-binding protein RefZ n=1 Tax=Halalkalibacter suaedae TaxID=2822140 RepID=A0A941ALU5_9BACI|nr:forespore capture DNA-binding protein RefZ [Bacillus suaedae]MBP3949780.1 forespore capture DNA-binding protein RefZ [Bacillus suaedae]
MKKETTKEKMLDAAIRLFHTQGYAGTSVRDIAQKANVNVALISYHFGGKKGLYEQLIIQFFEDYLHILESELQKESESLKDLLLQVIRALLEYQSKQYLVARMVHREMTLDSVLVRELMSTYLRKEKHEFEQLIKRGMTGGEFQRQPVDYVIIHLRTMITMPYLSPHYLRELYQLSSNEPYFIDRYMEHLTRWVHTWLCGEVKSQPYQSSLSAQLI